MTQLIKDDLQKQCDVLLTKGNALMASAYRYIDPEMADFVSHYLHALACDVGEAVGSEGKRRALLPLILSELDELVEDTRCRIEQAKGTALRDQPRSGISS